MSGALEGIRVLDLSTGIAGPMAAMFMADFGAEVVNVVDRGCEPGRRRLFEFVAGADVCVTSELGPDLDPSALSERYPGLIVLHTPPYVPTETPWPGMAESHGMLSALAGPACRQSSFDGGPIDLVSPLALYLQGQWAAATAVAALIERHRSGVGQVVSVAGIHGVMIGSAGQLVIVPSQQALPTNVGPGGRHPCYTTYQAGDGQWLFLAALIPKFQVNAFKVLGVSDIFADSRIEGMSSRLILPENRGWVRQRLSEAFLGRSRDEWLALLEEGDCPAGPLGERDEWLDHPQLAANGLRVDLEDPARGHVVMPGVALVMTQTPGEVRTPAPGLGQHDAEVEPWPPRSPLGPQQSVTASESPSRALSDTDRAESNSLPALESRLPAESASDTVVGASRRVERASPGGPLRGFRVLDLGTILAGPYAGALLAELGADVIKVEPPTGDAFREPGFIYNRGQRGLAIDLTSPDARQAFYQLMRSADAVVDNSRRGVMQRLHIDYASLASVKPDIVTLSINSFGEQGPLAHKPGFDPVLQAMSGLMTAQGGDSDPVLFTIPVNDVAAGTLAVLGVCLGLFHRLRTGGGQQVWTSLLGCSTMMQSGELVRFHARQSPPRGGRDHKGPSALDRFYQAKDGWLRLQAPNAESLVVAGLLDHDAPTTDEGLARAISERLASMPTVEALRCLTRAGIPAAAARSPGDLPDDPALQALDIFATQHMRDGTPFYVTNRYARFSRTQERKNFEVPGLGEHSRKLLADAGVSSDDIDALIACGAVKQGEPFKVVAIQNYR